MKTELYTTPETNYTKATTVQELLDALSLFRRDKPIMVINQKTGGIRGVSAYELNGARGSGHALSIGKSLFNNSDNAEVLSTELAQALFSNVYTDNGGCFTVLPSSKVFFAIVGTKEQSEMVGVTEINGTPIIITE